ncbi:hypothetical protein [Escherichia coli]|uniref:hypothetical protein n=1 Tax=Escherichia coli TaxID=562 RepID=UPI00266611E1|nr:hypothetical protein [Escherichia coli]MDO2866053.1 hypothetical protein [Escherichia coli]
MTTITKERLLTIKQWRETYGPGSNVVLPAEEAEELARITLASLEQNVLSGNSPLIPGEVLSAIREVARIRADFDDFDGDRRGIGDCLDEAEQELIVTINKYASQLAAEPIATNDVREGTVAKLAMRQPFVLFKGLTFQKLCLPGAFRPGDHHNKMLRPGLCVVHASPQYL